MKYMIQSTCNWDGEEVVVDAFGMVDTEEKAKELISSYPYIAYNLQLKYVQVCDDLEEIREKLSKRNEECRKDKIEDLTRHTEYRKEMVENNYNAIKILKSAKEFLDRYNLKEIEPETLRSLIPEMHKASLETGLPISFYDGEFDYESDGTIVKSKGERFTYMPIYVNIETSMACFYAYDHGENYDIEDNIIKLEKRTPELRQEVEEEIKELEDAMAWEQK